MLARIQQIIYVISAAGAALGLIQLPLIWKMSGAVVCKYKYYLFAFTLPSFLTAVFCFFTAPISIATPNILVLIDTANRVSSFWSTSALWMWTSCCRITFQAICASFLFVAFTVQRDQTKKNYRKREIMALLFLAIAWPVLSLQMSLAINDRPTAIKEDMVRSELENILGENFTVTGYLGKATMENTTFYIDFSLVNSISTTAWDASIIGVSAYLFSRRTKQMDYCVHSEKIQKLHRNMLLTLFIHVACLGLFTAIPLGLSKIAFTWKFVLPIEYQLGMSVLFSLTTIVTSIVNFVVFFEHFFPPYSYLRRKFRKLCPSTNRRAPKH